MIGDYRRLFGWLRRRSQCRAYEQSLLAAAAADRQLVPRNGNVDPDHPSIRMDEQTMAELNAIAERP